MSKNRQKSTKIDNEQGYSEISGLVDQWLMDCDGETFTRQDLWYQYNIQHSLAKEYLRRILTDRVNKGILRKEGKVFRKVDNGLSRMNWQRADSTEHLDLTFPLGEDRFIKVFPSSTLVIAGGPNSGKTAWLYSFILKNYHKHRISLFSNDMDAEEMKERFENFGVHIPEPPPFDVYQRWDKFEDVIIPDQINLVDFLKIYDSFWEIGKTIDAIQARVGRGLAIVAVQKNKGADMGRGGSFGLETPKVYLSLDFGKLRIVKARGRAKPDVEPRGLQIDFKLHRGAKFEELGYGWPE